MTERFINSENGNIFYCISRHGNPFAPCIIFLHGLSASHAIFEKQTAYFSRKNTVIAWDAPAHGKSRPYSDFTYKGASDALLSIMDAEGVSKAVLVGHSIGACIAQIFAERHPERVSGFLGLDATPFDASIYPKTDLRLLKQLGLLANTSSEKKLKETLAQTFAYSEESYRDMTDILAGLTKSELCSLLKQASSDLLAGLRDLPFSCPVLLVSGNRNKTKRITKYSEDWSKKYGYPLRVLSGTDGGDELNALIEEFCASLYPETETQI